MKKLLTYALVFLAASSGCKKVESLANISVNIPYSQQVEVPRVDGYDYGTPIPFGGVNLPFPAIPVVTNAKDYLVQYHTNANKVVSVSLKSLTLDIVSPASENFDFLDNVQLYLSAPGLPEQLLAYQNAIPKGATTVAVTTAGDFNLKEYFLKDTMYIRASMHINAVPHPGTQMKISSVFNLVANPLY